MVSNLRKHKKRKKLPAIIPKKDLCKKGENHRYQIYSRKLQQIFC